MNIGTLAITIAAVGINGAIKKTAIAVGKTLVVDMSSGIAGMVTMDLLEGAGSPEWLTKVAGLGVSFIGGYYGEKAINSIGNYSSLGKMSAKDGKRYQAYFDDIATGNHLPPGITDVENVKYLQGIEKLEEINALHTIDYEKIIKVREGVSETGGRTGYDYLDDQLGNLKGKVRLNKYTLSDEINDFWKQEGYSQPPYNSKSVVQQVELLEDTKFVRVYDEVHTQLSSGWLMNVEDINGLTPMQINAKYALDFNPIYVGEATISAGSKINIGEASGCLGNLVVEYKLI